jgi:hypothetical protein
MVYAVREDAFRPAWRWRRTFFWALFALGLLLQACGPHLKIKDNRFVLPPSLISANSEIRPAEIVERARRTQLLSSVLTLGGALGLALCYGKVLFGTRSARRDLVDRSPVASTRSRTVE